MRINIKIKGLRQNPFLHGSPDVVAKGFRSDDEGIHSRFLLRELKKKPVLRVRNQRADGLRQSKNAQ